MRSKVMIEIYTVLSDVIGRTVLEDGSCIPRHCNWIESSWVVSDFGLRRALRQNSPKQIQWTVFLSRFVSITIRTKHIYLSTFRCKGCIFSPHKPTDLKSEISVVLKSFNNRSWFALFCANGRAQPIYVRIMRYILHRNTVGTQSGVTNGTRKSFKNYT
jgi:hypothetical protein